MRYLVGFILVLNVALSQKLVPRYWNSLSTHVTVGVPLVEDESLIGGKIQLKVSFDNGNSFSDLGEKSIIDNDDIDNIKQVTVAAEIFESIEGFKEEATAKFIAKVWDRAGNAITGKISDSLLTVDQVLPELLSIEVTSSNKLDPKKATSSDSITFQLNASEPITKPVFNINDDLYEEAAGLDKSWMLVYPAEEAEDGKIEFTINYMDLAGNPGSPVIKSSDGNFVEKDGTNPELRKVGLSTSNSNDSLLAIKGDTVFLKFTASEKLRDIDVLLNSNDAILSSDGDLSYNFYHVFTESDSEGVIPFIINYADQSGNVGESIDETTNGSEVIFDMTPPADFNIELVASLQGDPKKKSKSKGKKSGNKSNEPDKEFGIIFIGIISFLSLSFLLYILSWVIIFRKAGHAWWKALVPFFNLFVLTKILKKPVWWMVIFLIIPIGYLLSTIQIGKVFGKGLVFSMGMIILPLIFYPLLAFGKAEYEKPAT